MLWRETHQSCSKEYLIDFLLCDSKINVDMDWMIFRWDDTIPRETINWPIKERQGWSRQPINPQMTDEGYRVPIIPFTVYSCLATGLQHVCILAHKHIHEPILDTVFLDQSWISKWLRSTAVCSLCPYQWMYLFKTWDLWVSFSFKVYFIKTQHSSS